MFGVNGEFTKTLIKGCLPLKTRYSQQAWEKVPREKLSWGFVISGLQVRQVSKRSPFYVIGIGSTY